jgi:hypothetical protein
LEGYPAWYKYQTEAMILILRWSPAFTDHVWTLLSECLNKGASSDATPSPIAQALLRRQDVTFLELGKNFGEARLWALLISKAEPETTSLDQLSDARDQIRRVTVQTELDLNRQVQLHENFNYGSGLRYTQKVKARLPRGVIGDGTNGTTIRDVVDSLANGAEYIGLTSKQLWPQFLGNLDRLGLDPEEHSDFPEWTKRRISYDFKDGRKMLTYNTFAKLVSEARKK